jgi:hypothetical protein
MIEGLFGIFDDPRRKFERNEIVNFFPSKAKLRKCRYENGEWGWSIETSLLNGALTGGQKIKVGISEQKRLPGEANDNGYEIKTLVVDGCELSFNSEIPLYIQPSPYITRKPETLDKKDIMGFNQAQIDHQNHFINLHRLAFPEDIVILYHERGHLKTTDTKDYSTTLAKLDDLLVLYLRLTERPPDNSSEWLKAYGLDSHPDLINQIKTMIEHKVDVERLASEYALMTLRQLKFLQGENTMNALNFLRTALSTYLDQQVKIWHITRKIPISLFMNDEEQANIINKLTVSDIGAK